MITLAYALTSASRISAGAGPEVGNNRSIHQVIPGGTVRGALATAFVRDHGLGWKQDRVRDVFERAAWFSQAVPLGYRLLGRSRVSCKYSDPDLPHYETPEHALLIAQDTGDVKRRCPSCRESWKQGEGWEKPGKASGIAPIEVAVTRTELDGGVAKDERLFTRRAIRRDVVLTGHLRIDESLISAADLDWLRADHRLRVGGQRSVLGDTAWETGEPSEPARPVVDSGSNFVVQCESPALLVDAYGSATLDAEPALQTLFGSRVSVKASWTRTERVAGWHMASGLAKPEEWALAAGSTFVLTNAPADVTERCALGIGLRRREGYGALRILTSHEVRPQADITRLEPESPAAEAPPAQRPVAESPESETRNNAETRLLEAIDQLANPGPARRGLAEALTSIIKLRESGLAPAVSMTVRDTMARPWARELSGDSRTLLHGQLTSRDVSAMKALRDQAGGH